MTAGIVARCFAILLLVINQRDYYVCVEDLYQEYESGEGRRHAKLFHA